MSSLAETDESIACASTRSPGGSRPIPRLSPGAEAVGCTDLHYPPGTVQAYPQSSARWCM